MNNKNAPRVDWGRIDSKTAVWCKTEEEARAFLAAAEERGMRWGDGQMPTKINRWEVYTSDTCYVASESGLAYCLHGWYKANGYTIITFAELLVSDAEEAAEKPSASGGICKALGVEEDEVWEYPELLGSYRIHGGKRQTLIGGRWENCNSEAGISIMLEHPERIIRKPRYTPEQLAAMRALRAAGAEYVARDATGELYWYEGEPELEEGGIYDSLHGEDFGRLPANLFPSIQPGQCVKLEDVVSGR